MDGERELSDEEAGFLHGNCHLFAVALHRLTGLPLRAILDVDMWTEQTVLAHAFVVDGEQAIDIRGRIEMTDVGDEFETNDPWETDISEQDLLLLGNGNEDLNIDDDAFLTACSLAQAMASELNLEVNGPGELRNLARTPGTI
jgi:hypothetical protein